MVSIRRIAILAVLFALLLPSLSFSQSATIGVYRANGTPACPLPAGEFVVLQVKLNATAAPLSKARFKLVPSCPGATIVGPVDYDLTLSPCAQSGAVLATILVTPPASCSSTWGFYFDVVPYTGDATLKLTDCNGFPITGVDAIQKVDYSPCDVNSNVIAPYKPTPADGSSNVPLNTTLSYVGPANMIQLSTQPIPPSIGTQTLCAPAALSYLNKPVCGYPVDPGPLAPNTTYYWRAWNSSWGFNALVASSDMFSFTTGDAPLPTAAATWGHVKSMYRD